MQKIVKQSVEIQPNLKISCFFAIKPRSVCYHLQSYLQHVIFPYKCTFICQYTEVPQSVLPIPRSPHLSVLWKYGKWISADGYSWNEVLAIVLVWIPGPKCITWNFKKTLGCEHEK